jgi:hypothetical protein
MTTALILRDPKTPPVHVLEEDGTTWKHRLRYAGSYYLTTSNSPSCDDFELKDSNGRRGCLRDWCQPHWEIYQMPDGDVKVHACRPTYQEVIRGELFGRWGSVINLGKQPTRESLRLALHLARLLCRCIPTEGISIAWDSLLFFGPIETEIPIRLIARSIPSRNQSAA